MGNWKTPVHRGFLSDLTIGLSVRKGLSGSVSDVPVAVRIGDGTLVAWKFALVGWFSKLSLRRT